MDFLHVNIEKSLQIIMYQIKNHKHKTKKYLTKLSWVKEYQGRNYDVHGMVFAIDILNTLFPQNFGF